MKILCLFIFFFLLILYFCAKKKQVDSFVNFPIRGYRFDPEIVEKSGGMAGFSSTPYDTSPEGGGYINFPYIPYYYPGLNVYPRYYYPYQRYPYRRYPWYRPYSYLPNSLFSRTYYDRPYFERYEDEDVDIEDVDDDEEGENYNNLYIDF